MSGADLFVDGFPHGTARGYELGCRGAACPAKVEFGQSCREANIRVASDWGYRRLVQRGASVEEQRLPEIASAPAVKAPTPAKPIEHVMQERVNARRDRDVPVPTPRPRPPAPTPVAPDLAQWPEESAPQPAGSLAKSQGAFASHPKQRDHALATASDEHPMGLTLGGEPRRRCAPGTVLVGGVLRRAEDVTEAEIEAAQEATPATKRPRERCESRSEHGQQCTMRAGHDGRHGHAGRDYWGPRDAQPEISESPAAPSPEPAVEVEPSVVEEEPRPRGKRVLDDALRTITEAAELQRALAVITERALRTARVEINHMRREAAALENQQEK